VKKIFATEKNSPAPIPVAEPESVVVPDDRVVRQFRLLQQPRGLQQPLNVLVCLKPENIFEGFF
jgi:hypothetical protein